MHKSAWVDNAFRSYELVCNHQDEHNMVVFGARVTRHELLSPAMWGQYINACNRDAHRAASVAASKTDASS